MPSTPTTTMIAANLNDLSSKINDEAFDRHPLLDILMANGRKEPADPALALVEHLGTGHNSTIANRDYKTTIPLGEQDPMEDVQWEMRHINGSIVWFIWQEQVNRGKHQIFNFTTELKANAVESFADALGAAIWQDGTGENLHGLPAIISATNTYMTKLRTTAGNEYWRAKTGAAFTVTRGNVVRTFGPFSTAGVLSIIGGVDGGIQGFRRALCRNGGFDSPDVGLTTEALYARIESLIEPTRIRQDPKVVELGWDEHFMCQGMRIFWDCNASLDGTGTDNPFIGLNTKYLKIRPATHNADKPTMDGPYDRMVEGQRAVAMIMNWDGNLTCVRPSSCGALTAKTAS